MANSVDRERFVADARAVLDRRYWHRHPFHERMHAGGLSRDEVRDWVHQRVYYQARMPVKDALILARLPGRAERRVWLPRLVDQDGSAGGDEGGFEQWLRLAEGVGLSPEQAQDPAAVRPGVRFAVDAYVAFCAERPWPEAVAASLTQLFVPDLMQTRMDAFLTHYGFKDHHVAYFDRHRAVAQDESEQAIDLLMGAMHSSDDCDRALAAIEFKCDVLGAFLDAVAAR